MAEAADDYHLSTRPWQGSEQIRCQIFYMTTNCQPGKKCVGNTPSTVLAVAILDTWFAHTSAQQIKAQQCIRRAPISRALTPSYVGITRSCGP